jgi:hypothetical protein
MNQISSTEELLAAIEAMEAENVLKASQLKAEFELTVEMLNPALAVTKTLRDVASSSNLLEEVLGTAFGIASGWLSRKLYVRGSSSPFRKLIGIIVQFGMTNLAANNFDVVKSFAGNLFQNNRADKKGKSDHQ